MDLLNVFQQRRLIANALATAEEDESDKERALEVSQDTQEKLKKDYLAISDRSEAKLILGLQIISSQLEAVIIQNQLKQIKQSIDVKGEDLKRREAELSYALKHLSSSEMQLQALSAEVVRSQDVWAAAKEALTKKEAEAANVKGLGLDEAPPQTNNFSVRNLPKSLSQKRSTSPTYPCYNGI